MKAAACFEDIKPIDDELKKRCAMTKRKRGLFKKAIEMSILCEVDVFVCLFDRNRQKIFELNSEEDFDIQILSHMLDKVNKHQFKCKKFTNKDYDSFKIDKKIDIFGDSDAEHDSEAN